jgi:hypothetical protein
MLTGTIRFNLRSASPLLVKTGTEPIFLQLNGALIGSLISMRDWKSGQQDVDSLAAMAHLKSSFAMT